MILQALYRYYDRLLEEHQVPEFGFSRENVGFVLEIDKCGNLIQEHDIRKNQGAKPRPAPLEVPYTNSVNVRSVNIEANFLVDKAAYLLGNDRKTKNERLLECHQTFKKLLHKLLDGLEDVGARAVLKFYETWQPEQAPDALHYWDDMSSGEVGFIAFRLAGERGYIHLRPLIKNAWQTYLKKQGHKPGGNCLVSGFTNVPLQQLHAQFKGIAGGQPSGMSLVSFNIKSAESYGKEQSINAPVSVQAEFKSSTALKYLVHSQTHRLYITDTFTVYWTDRDSPVEGMFGLMLDPKDVDAPDNAAVRRFLDAVRKGKRPEEIDPNVRFYILGLSPNKARLAVRFWYVCSVGELEERIGQHFRDLQMQRSFDFNPEYPGIRRIIWETFNKKSKTETASPLLAGTLVRSILEGTAYPQELQNSIIRRIRADSDINYVRAATLKAILVRKQRIYRQGMEVTMSLDKENKNPAYLLGRLFAVLEKAQQAALGKDIGATIKDRFFGSASATPRAIFPQLVRLAQHHIPKAKYGNFYDRQIQEILCDIQQFPTHLTLDEQSGFILGYYHQRQDFFNKHEIQKQNEEQID